MDRIGPYLIQKKIGAGGMGTVYYARHEASGAEAAVKVLPASLAREDGFIARFSREIESLQKLKNSHVVELYESGVDNDTYYYAMEYVDGETLTQRLRRERRLPWREVVGIAVQICSALKAAHDAGIIHRDLKPSNLLIAKDGQVKLTDFGVAQVFAGTKLTKTGGIIGTAEYMSPEQAKGQRATKKSDLYSLGAVLYVMLTGRPPFSGQTTLDVIHKHQYAQFERPSLLVPEIPVWIEEVVCQLLDKDPDKRFSDAYVLSRKLEEIVRRIDHSSQDDTLATGDRSGGTAPTQALNAEASGPGPATLMRDLLRAEIEHSQRPSTLSRMFDSTWVLIGGLALLVIGGVWWFSSGRLSAEERFNLAQSLLDESGGAKWREAEQYLTELLAEDRARWEPEVAPLLEDVEIHKLEHELHGKSPLGKRRMPQGEVERFLRRAQLFQEVGDFAGAQTTLESLAVLLADLPEYDRLLQLTKRELEELRSREQETPDKLPVLEASMSKADQLAEQGELDEAKRIWNGVVELYVSDPDAALQVERARKLLSEAGGETAAGIAHSPDQDGITAGP